MNWSKGDIAICVDNSDVFGLGGILPNLRKNVEYIVNGVRTCECGSTALDIGLLKDKETIMKCNCGISTSGSEIRWCSSERFVKRKTNTELEEELEAALLDEDYEKAANIKSLIK